MGAAQYNGQVTPEDLGLSTRTGPNDHEDRAPTKNFDILKRLAGTVKQRSFATIDIEAREWVHPYAVGFYDGRQYSSFIGDDCITKALAFVLQPKFMGRWIYAHNGGNYDFQFFLRALIFKMSSRYKTEVTPIGSCMFRFDVYEIDRTGAKKSTHNNRAMKWTFIDSARLMPIRLNDVGETFGIGKKVELPISYDELALPENRPLMEKYLEQDCRLLYAAIDKMQATINKLGGQLGPTLPSTALDLFRRRYLKEDIQTNRHFITCADHGREASKRSCAGCGHEFIRKAYAGGRGEIFRMRFVPSPGHEKARLYDVNSMYPGCMLDNMPIGPGITFDNVSEAFVYENAKTKTGIVDCLVEIPADCYLPPLPVKGKGGKLMFPVGRFRGTWDTAELTLLRQVGGRILETGRSMWFDEGNVFTGFVRSVYKFRDKSLPTWNKGMDWIAKILLNAAYGKFAMKEHRSRYLIHPDELEGLTPIDMTSDIWSEDIVVSPNYIVPQLAVHITALARRRLWEIMWGVLQQGGRVYYCDTDSVVCSGVELATGKLLGQLKLENVIVRAEFVLPKLYLIETEEESDKKKSEITLKIKAKGMGPGIKLGDSTNTDPYDGQLSEAEFIDLIKNGAPLMRHRLTKFRESLKDAHKKATTFPRVIPAPKQIQTRYDKRTVLDDYNTVPIKYAA